LTVERLMDFVSHESGVSLVEV